MKIAIVGCGAMGSVYAGLFASAGHEVWAIDRWAEHVAAMKKNGLRLEGKSGDRTVKVNATTDTKDAGPCGLAECTTEEVMNDPDLACVSAACATEAYAVARAKGMKLGFTDSVAYVRDFASRIPKARPSVLLDLMARRLSEIDVINGSIPRVGQQVGVAAPVNETVTALVKARERALGCA